MDGKPKAFIRRCLRSVGLEVRYYRKDQDQLRKPKSEAPKMWSQDKKFLTRMEEIKDTTLLSENRCFMLYQLAKHMCVKPGEMAEVGVFKGGTAKLIAKTCPNKTLHCFDTFAGMPSVDKTVDLHREGDFADTSLPEVQRFLADCNNIRFHQGRFPETADAVNENEFCLIYVDVDIYQSVKDCLEFFYPRLVSGGVMVFDDYEWRACPGVKKAIDEFLIDKEERIFITTLYQAMLLKN